MNTSPIVALAIVDQNNIPLLLRTKLNCSKEEELQFLYLLHSSLDMVDERQNQPQNRDAFLGLLVQGESYKVYGLLSACRMKLVLMVSTAAATTFRDNEARQMLKTVHSALVEATSTNPFYQPGQPIKSRHLESTIDSVFGK